MSDVGYIHIHWDKGKPKEYTWEGGNVVYVDYRTLNFELDIFPSKMPDDLVFGQFKLKKLSDHMSGAYYSRAGDYGEWFRWLSYRWGFFIEDVGRKIIMTLYIWGLADHDSTMIPSWSDVKLVKWIKEKLRK